MEKKKRLADIIEENKTLERVTRQRYDFLKAKVGEEILGDLEVEVFKIIPGFIRVIYEEMGLEYKFSAEEEAIIYKRVLRPVYIENVYNSVRAYISQHGEAHLRASAANTDLKGAITEDGFYRDLKAERQRAQKESKKV